MRAENQIISKLYEVTSLAKSAVNKDIICVEKGGSREYFLLSLNVAALVASCVLVFSINWPLLYHNTDGIYLFILQRLHHLWAPEVMSLSGNPLQGMGGLFSNNLWLTPANLLTALVGGDYPIPTLVYTTAAAEAFVAIVFLCRTVGISFKVGFVAGWMIVLLSMQFFWPPLLFPMSNVFPNLMEFIALECIIIGLFYRIGRNGLVLSICIAALIGFLLVWGVLAEMTFFALSLPSITFCGIVFVLMADNSVERRVKVVVLFGLGPLVVLLLAPSYLGMALYQKATLFGDELVYGDQHALGAVTILFDQYYAMNQPFFLMAAAGAVLVALGGMHGGRKMAVSTLAFIGLLLLFVPYFLVFRKFIGPSPSRFELFVWPMYAIFSAVWIVIFVPPLWKRIWTVVSEHWTGIGDSAIVAAIKRRPALALLFMPITTGIFAASSERAHCCPWAYEPRLNPIVASLRNDIALRPEMPFRGVVATFTGYTGDLSTSWLKLVATDLYLHRRFGNDMRSLGLWYHDIPTLVQYGHVESPPFHFAMSRMLSRPEDKHIRNITVLTKPDFGYLRTVGVSRIITDFPLDDPRVTLITSIATRDTEECSGCASRWGGDVPTFNSQLPDTPNWTEGFRKSDPQYTIYLYDLNNANLANYSPTIMIMAPTAAEAIIALKDPERDFTREAIIEEAPATDLVPVVSSNIRMVAGGVAVEAESLATSLLVLPIQYTNCLEIEESDDPDALPKLVRVNVAQAGLLFSRNISTKIRLSFGPLTNSFCRLEDVADMKRIKMGR